MRLAMVLYLGGGMGNLIDRINQGYVTDFISVGNFYVFNIADACITSGAVVLAVDIWLKEQKQKKNALLETARTVTQVESEKYSNSIETAEENKVE